MHVTHQFRLRSPRNSHTPNPFTTSTLDPQPNPPQQHRIRHSGNPRHGLQHRQQRLRAGEGRGHGHRGYRRRADSGAAAGGPGGRRTGRRRRRGAGAGKPNPVASKIWGWVAALRRARKRWNGIVRCTGWAEPSSIVDGFLALSPGQLIS